MKRCYAAMLLMDALSLGVCGSLNVSGVYGSVEVPNHPKVTDIEAPIGWAVKDVNSGNVIKKKPRPSKQMKKAPSGMDFLGSLDTDMKTLQLNEFLPKCMRHVDNLIGDMDYNYGDVQLETVLRNYCAHTKEFPLSHGGGDGFLAHVPCNDFAKDLWDARVLELKSQSTSGYEKFCTKFYEHHGGRDPVQQKKKKESPEKYSAASTPSVFYVAAIVAFMGATN